MLQNHLSSYNIILASQSPRRQFLLKELNLEFTIDTSNSVDESYPDNLKSHQIALYLAEKKAAAFKGKLQSNDLVITSDTIVWLNEQVLNKPKNYEDAFRMLKLLSGNKHQVITGVCLFNVHKKKSFYSYTDVFFKNLSDEEIEFYLQTHKPYDKAGSYGIQEWIGYIGIESIHGSYFNVMGLPIQRLYEELIKF